MKAMFDIRIITHRWLAAFLLAFPFLCNSTTPVWLKIDGLMYGIGSNEQFGTFATVYCLDEKVPNETLVIPDSIEYNSTNVPVCAINFNSFNNVKNLKTFVCGKNIRYIKDYAFYNSSLSKIIFPDEEVRVNMNAFIKCTNLDTLVFNSKLTYFEATDLLYFYETSIKHIKFENRVVFVDDYYFYWPHDPDLNTMTSQVTWENNIPKCKPGKYTQPQNREVEYREIDIDWGDGEHVICPTSMKWYPGRKLTITGHSRSYRETGGMPHGLWTNAEIIEIEKRIPWKNEPEEALEPSLFYDCYSLKSVICRDPEPWPVSDMIFDQKLKKVTLYVPAEAIETYKNHPAWGKFSKILPIESSVADIDIDNADTPVEYYNLQGVRIDNPATGTIVIRRQGNNVTKMQVR